MRCSDSCSQRIFYSYFREHGELQPGDAAPQAYTGTKRTFPEWYKPYYLNYRRDGFFLTMLGLSFLCRGVYDSRCLLL